MNSANKPHRRQSNVQELEESLIQPGANMSSRSAFSQSKVLEFATPKAKAKPRPRIQITSASEEKTGAKKKFKNKADEFATPRAAAHSKSKKVVPRDRVGSPPIRLKLLKKGLLSHKSPTPSNVPTAHVFPSSYSPSTMGETTVTSPALSTGPCSPWHDKDMTYSDTTLTQGSSPYNDTVSYRRGKDRLTAMNSTTDFHELMTDPDNTVLDTTTFSYSTSTGYHQDGKPSTGYQPTHQDGKTGYLNPPHNGYDLNSRDNLRDYKSIHHSGSKMGGGDIDRDLTRTVSALSLDAPTTVTSDPGLGGSGGMYGLYAPCGHPPHHLTSDMYTGGHSGQFSSYERLPTSSFQAASYGPQYRGAGYMGNNMGNNMGSNMGNNMGNNMGYPSHSLPPSMYEGSAHYPGEPHFTNDLSHWQQQHQQQLHRQQLEAQQVSMPGRSVTPPAVSGGVPGGDPHRLTAIKRAADNIIKEKDNIIDRQKMKLLELERRNKDTEVEIHKSLLKKVQCDGDSLSMKLQESQYETASVKAQYIEVLNSQEQQIDSLNKKLAATEYELVEERKSKDKEMSSKDLGLREMQAKLDAACEQTQDYRQKYVSAKKGSDDLQAKVTSLERYLADLPTADEQSRSHLEIRSLKEDKHKYKHRAQELERKVRDLQKGIGSRDALVDQLEKGEKDRREAIEKIQKERDSYESQVQQLRQQGAKIPEEELLELSEENLQLKADCDKAKKLLDSQYKKLQHLDAQHQQEIAQLEERLYQDESSVTALRDDITSKEQHLHKVRVQIKELGSKNQDLMEQNMILSDKVKEFEKQHTGEAEKLQKRLLREMGVCFSELQSLVQICVQHAEGQDPNISVLLGVRTNTMFDLDSGEPVGDGLPSLKYKCTKMKELREEVDKLRGVLSNKFAEDMGENLNCTTQ